MLVQTAHSTFRVLILVVVDIIDGRFVFGVSISSSTIPFWNATFDNYSLFYFYFMCNMFMMMVLYWYFILKLQSGQKK